MVVAHICCKASSDACHMARPNPLGLTTQHYACHTTAILDAAHDSVQQPARNPVVVQTHLQSHFLPHQNVTPQLMTS